MRSLNRVSLMGYLATDPEVKSTTTGKAVANFKIATNYEWKSPEGEKKQATDFHKIVAWKKLGELCGQYLKKGSPVYLEGHLMNSKFEGKDGTTRYATEIVADELNFIDVKKTKDSQEINLIDVSPAE